MKTELNRIIKTTAPKVDEVSLFRAMARAFSRRPPCKSTYVQEIHGGKSMVTFPSMYKTGGTATTELGDLLIFTFDTATRELRMCVLQAKYKRGNYSSFLNAQADLFQWELLHDKPTIASKNKLNIPPNILNFRTDYESISAYGIFYHDNINRDIDFLYTLPDFFSPINLPPNPVSNGGRRFRFRCPHGLGSPNAGCFAGANSREAVSTCSIDVFETYVLSCKVGAPIPQKTPIAQWALALLENMLAYADDPNVIRELLDNYGNDNNDIRADIRPFDETLPALVVVTNSREYR